MKKRTLELGQSSSCGKRRSGLGSETPRQVFLGLGQRPPAGPCLWAGMWVSQWSILLAGKRVVARADLEETTSCCLPLHICVQRVMAQREQRELVPMSKNRPASSGEVQRTRWCFGNRNQESMKKTPTWKARGRTGIYFRPHSRNRVSFGITE